LINVERHLEPPRFPKVPIEIENDPEKYQAWSNDWLKTDEGKAWSIANEKYNQLKFESEFLMASVKKDGTFVLQDLPAGDYALRLFFDDHLPGTISNYKFTVPSTGTGPVELGELPLHPLNR